MQTMMVKSGNRYRKATPAEVSEIAGFFARQAMNKAKPQLIGPRTAITYLQAIYQGLDYETFSVLFIDKRYQLIECVEMFRGTIDGASVHPREVVKEALWRGAAAVVLAHNHPSGVAEPSQADIGITIRLREALALIDVRVVDHLIIGAAGSYCSLAERGDI
jgi:DNA repair protein RadC